MAERPQRGSEMGSETQGHDVDQLDSPAIEFENISTTFTDRQVLNGVNLRVLAGQTTALMGEEQAGKSVLVRHLLGTVKPTQGRVLLNGESIWDMPEDRFSGLSDGFGMIEGERRTHDNKLDSDRSVIDNLAAPLVEGGMSEEDAQAKATLCIEEWELGESADIRADELDTVARRRLALAQAFVGDPPVVIIDDPRSAFDIHHIDSEVRVYPRLAAAHWRHHPADHTQH